MTFRFLVLLIFWGYHTQAQDFFVAEKEVVGFTEHLIRYGHLKQAVEFASAVQSKQTVSSSVRDSLYYYLALSYDQLHKDSLSVSCYLAVKDSSPLFVRSRFLAVQKLINRKDFKQANEVISQVPQTDSPETNEIRNFLETGTGLMIGKRYEFKSPGENTHIYRPDLQAEQQHLSNLAQQKAKTKKRSPWIAGILSAIVPGLGKVYSGSNAQGLSTFIRVAIFGGLATENYLRQGIKNPQFWLFGGIASVYYVGGIYGSAYLPKLNYQEKIDAIDQDAKVGLLTPY